MLIMPFMFDPRGLERSEYKCFNVFSQSNNFLHSVLGTYVAIYGEFKMRQLYFTVTASNLNLHFENLHIIVLARSKPGT